MTDYSLSFTAASLMHYETEQVAELFKKYQDWSKVQQIIVGENMLQKGTIATRKREFTEIKKRLLHITDQELEFMLRCTTDELKLFCFFLCCRTYRLIFEFVSQTLREKYLTFDYSVLNSDYERFIESKRASSAKLQSITETTINKIKQVIFKILEQAMLIDSIKEKNLLKPYLSIELEEVISLYSPKYLSGFFYSDRDIKVVQERLNA